MGIDLQGALQMPMLFVQIVATWLRPDGSGLKPCVICMTNLCAERNMGEAARERVVQQYSLHSNLPILAEVTRKLIEDSQ